MTKKHFFVCGNTAKGFRNFFESNLQQLNKIFILKGGPGTGKSTLMRKIGEELEELYDVEYIHCSADPDSLDGVLIPKIGVGVVDGTAPHVIEPTAPGAIEEYVNLGEALDSDKLSSHTKEILSIEKNIKKCYKKAYEEFANAIQVHDEWEKIYIKNMDFVKADKLTEDVSKKLLGSIKLNKVSSIKHRFFGGSTHKGPMDFVENITENIKKRYFIKGRPGSGKSTMLKKILKDAKEKGIDMEVYHCGFDPDSLDMLLFPELSLCIFDSTAPHEYFPNKDGDSIIDMYSELIKPNTDEIYQNEINDIVSRYKKCNSIGTSKLKEAKDYHDKLEDIYIQNTDFTIVNEIYKKLREKIIKYNK
ncbi:PRK06851 family protein [Clostridium sp. BJN0001]|uniref:PRK06851 family protein n=1 Tax=Clostridium sp. BJN0001 TaxID=2930219 RepID=UPI001FD3D91A|nr:PRK06851 family protein [Clostridium sp. BJN0001]